MTTPPGSDEALVVTRHGAVATLWLNRPAKRNAINLAMWRGIADVVSELADDRTVRVLVVRGVGSHFCAGADITELGEHLGTEGYTTANRDAEAALAAFPKPTVALISGSCVGGGTEIAITCDIRIADASARFGITPARLGIVYPAFAVERAVQVLGPDTTRLLLLTGDLIDAPRAGQLGLVHELHTDADAAEKRVHELASTLATERSLLAQQAAKEMVAAVVEHGSVDDALVARWAREMAAAVDRAEGLAAFGERRAPKFGWLGPTVAKE